MILAALPILVLGCLCAKAIMISTAPLRTLRMTRQMHEVDKKSHVLTLRHPLKECTSVLGTAQYRTQHMSGHMWQDDFEAWYSALRFMWAFFE